MQMRTKLGVCLVILLAVLVGGSIAWATIPDANGVIHACYNTSSGKLSVMDASNPKLSACAANEAPLSWDQQGAQGPSGPQGVRGETGPKGPTGDSAVADAYVSHFGTNTGQAQAANGTTCTLGEMRLTASPTRTAGGVPATGQLLPINQNQALFALLGTTYGGNGITTFALPDLRAVTPNNMTYSICIAGVFPSTT
jgi:Phage Tail Collar Domain